MSVRGVLVNERRFKARVRERHEEGSDLLPVALQIGDGPEWMADVAQVEEIARGLLHVAGAARRERQHPDAMDAMQRQRLEGLREALALAGASDAAASIRQRIRDIEEWERRRVDLVPVRRRGGP